MAIITRFLIMELDRHVGRVSVPSQTGGYPPLAPTSEHLPGMHPLFGQENATEPYVDSQAMTEEDIRDMVEQFALAAKNAIRAGFDGVEIHGQSASCLSFVPLGPNFTNL